MRELSLRRHGERINPTYTEPSSGEGVAGLSTDSDRPDGEISGIVKRYRKDQEASTSVTAIGLIKAHYPDAIEYTGIAAHVRGLTIFFAVFVAIVSIWLGQLFLFDLIEKGLESTFQQVLSFFACVFMAFGLYFLLVGVRLELFRPEDEPVIFDRKNRKVYRLFREVHPGVIGLFKRWRIHAAEYEWDLIDAEHNAVLTTTGSTAMRYHSLVFIVRKSRVDSTIIDSFPVGNTVQLGEFSVATVWEHIRRFMEENGPHLPPGEPVNMDKAPQTLWESWVVVAPIGHKYVGAWKSMPWFMFLLHVSLPLSAPMFFFWGIFNWLSYKTSTRIRWPQEVLQAVRGYEN